MVDSCEILYCGLLSNIINVRLLKPFQNSTVQAYPLLQLLSSSPFPHAHDGSMHKAAGSTSLVLAGLHSRRVPLQQWFQIEHRRFQSRAEISVQRPFLGILAPAFAHSSFWSFEETQ
ncbi:hypothetical protein V6N13_146259 [Hibiscus sabdariffa]|uniref:Uncharacterized protein n=1 Tax=Hibiscus sabdariffa TaxID=183260 RepID=A0ABR2TS45_9ROSI